MAPLLQMLLTAILDASITGVQQILHSHKSINRSMWKSGTISRPYDHDRNLIPIQRTHLSPWAQLSINHSHFHAHKYSRSLDFLSYLFGVRWVICESQPWLYVFFYRSKLASIRSAHTRNTQFAHSFPMSIGLGGISARHPFARTRHFCFAELWFADNIHRPAICNFTFRALFHHTVIVGYT